MSYKFPVRVDGESPVSGVGQGGSLRHVRAVGDSRHLVEIKIPGRENPGPEAPGVLPDLSLSARSCSCRLGRAGWAAPGSPSRGFGLGAGSAASGPGGRCFLLDLALTKRGVYSWSERENL